MSDGYCSDDLAEARTREHRTDSEMEYDNGCPYDYIEEGDARFPDKKRLVKEWRRRYWEHQEWVEARRRVMNPWASTYPTVKYGHWPYLSWVPFTMTIEDAETILVSKGYSFKMVDGPHGPVRTCVPPETKDFLIPNTMMINPPPEVNGPTGEKNPSQDKSLE